MICTPCGNGNHRECRQSHTWTPPNYAEFEARMMFGTLDLVICCCNNEDRGVRRA